jgi:hypothetical protein
VIWRKRPKPFYRTDEFTLAVSRTKTITYAEGHNEWSLPAALDTRPPQLHIPRPEVWDYVVPAWLQGRYDSVMNRLVAHSGCSVMFDSDDQHADAIRHIEDNTESTRAPCPCCDTDIVAPKHETSYRPGESILDIRSTHAAVEARVADGRFEVIRSDVPIDRMLSVLDEESKYTIVAYLRCTLSSETIFWGLSIRGDPIYRHTNESAPFVWPWDTGRPQVDNAPTNPGDSA